MQWYSVDFGRNDHERLQWVLPFLAADKFAALSAMLADGGPIRVAYREYDWALNGDD